MGIADNLQLHIKRRGLSIKAVSLGAQIPQSTVSQWISGKQEPKAEALWRLAKFLGVSVDSLIGGHEALVVGFDQSHVVLETGNYLVAITKIEEK